MARRLLVVVGVVLVLVGALAPGAAAQSTPAEPRLVAVRGRDDALWFRQVPGAGWRSLGGRLIAVPAVVEFLGRPLFLGVGTDRYIWARRLDSYWQRVSPPGTVCTSVNAAVNATPRLVVACRGGNGLIYVTHSRHDSPSLAPWRGFGRPPGTSNHGAAVVTEEREVDHESPTTKRTVLVALGSDRPWQGRITNLYTSPWEGGPDWSVYGADFRQYGTPAPAVCATLPAVLPLTHIAPTYITPRAHDHLACRDRQKRPYHYLSNWEGALFGEYGTTDEGVLPGRITGTVAATGDITSVIHVFALGTNGVVYGWHGSRNRHDRTPFTWVGPSRLGGIGIGGVAVLPCPERPRNCRSDHR